MEEFELFRKIENFYEEETLNCQMSRKTFISLYKEHFGQFRIPMNKVLSDAKKKEKYINKIILISGLHKNLYIIIRIIY
jgi:molecular chaperone DnaK (HSP70)